MTYCYVCKTCGKTDQKILPSSKWRKKIECPGCGKTMCRDIRAEQSGFIDRPGSWPMESDACGVHPDQAKEYAAYLREQGVPTEVRENGNPVFTSREHRKRACAAAGMYDRNAGYGDQAPINKIKRRKRMGAKERKQHLSNLADEIGRRNAG